MTKNALPQAHCATQHWRSFLSRDCRAAFATNSSFRMGWRNSGMWRGRACCWLQAVQHLTPPLWLNAPAKSAFLCHLPSSTHSHWAMPSTVTQKLAAFGATSQCFLGAIQLVQRPLVAVMWGHYQLVFRRLGLGGAILLQS